MIMGDTPEVRVFDSVTAAVANSAQPPPPPYADVTAEPVTDEQPDVVAEPPAAVPPKPKASARKTGQHVRAQAGAAEGSGAAMGPGE